ncbi:archaea-specific SMC-related protein [Salarchaeum japonicum]|uniref:Chromosome segregation protein SMC n=1 Tax=Salarchaeum japonicum TaxID=555573 RepID=A0AAV3T3Z4_9EURY|nr:archaea-specific SMC-related protein [Salarchaeum japonicum]
MTFELTVRNVGGIDELETTFGDGVTLLSGPNASNKTSLLHALTFALGSDDVPLRSGTSRAEVTLSNGDRSVTRTAERAGTGLSVSGESWLGDADNADDLVSFATFLEFNDLRAAVRNGDSFEETLKAPLEVSSLEAERAAKIAEKQSLEDDRDDLEGAADDLADVEASLSEARERVASLEDDLDDLLARTTADEDDELAALRDRRTDLAAERDEQRRRVENTEDAIERLENRLETVEADLADARSTADEHDAAELRAEKERLERRVAERENRLDVLQSVLTANREMLNGDFTGALGQDAGLTGDEYACWACGQNAPESAFEGTLDDLVDLVERDRERLEDHRPRIEAVSEDLAAAEDAAARVRDLEADRREVVESLRERRSSLATQRERLEELEGDLDDLDERIAAREHERAAEADGVVAEIEETRAALRDARSTVGRLEDRRRRLESAVAEYEELEKRIAELSSDITALTDRIENAEAELRESFNEAMDDLVSVLEFERVQRVWLDGDFELVIAREVEGAVQQESVRHLAESERELIGLVLCLAGCLTYDVPEAVPVVAVDSMGAFDVVRAQRLVEYVGDRVDHLLVAMHPDRASALEFSVTEIRDALSA